MEEPERTELKELAENKYNEIMQKRESYIEAFIAETGLKPSQCELIEQRVNSLETRIYIRPIHNAVNFNCKIFDFIVKWGSFISYFNKELEQSMRQDLQEFASPKTAVQQPDKAEMSFKEKVDLFVDKVFGGYHHIQKVLWDLECVKNEHISAEIITHHSTFASYDFSELTRMVILAHDLCMRVEINPLPGKFKIRLHNRSREGEITKRHPTIEESIIKIRSEYSSL